MLTQAMLDKHACMGGCCAVKVLVRCLMAGLLAMLRRSGGREPLCITTWDAPPPRAMLS